MTAKKNPGPADALRKKKSGGRAGAGAITSAAVPQVGVEPSAAQAGSRTKPSSPTAADAEMKKTTLELPLKWYAAVRKKAFQLETTQRAVYLAIIEEFVEGGLDDIVKTRTANGRLEGKRGPRGGLHN